MNLHQLAKDHEALRRAGEGASPRGAFDLPQLALGGIRHHDERLPSEEEPIGVLARHGVVAGWVQQQSRQWLFTNGLQATDPADGRLISAECVLPDGRSLRVRRHPEGGYCLRLCEHLDNGAVVWDWAEHLGAGGYRLRYRRYWTQEGPTLRPTLAVLFDIAGGDLR